MWVVRLDASGHTTWQRTYGGSGDDELDCVAVTSDSGYVVGGSSTPASGGQIVPIVMRLDGQGNLRWQTGFTGTTGDNSFVRAIKQTADGGYILVVFDFGEIRPSGSGATVVKLTAAGSIQWSKAYGDAGDTANDIVPTPDGGYLLLMAPGTPLRGGALILRLDANGNATSQRMYSVQAPFIFLYPLALTLADDGSYAVAGYATRSPNTELTGWLMSVHADGSIAWQKTYRGPTGTAFDPELALDSVAPTLDRGYVASGTVRTAGGTVARENGLLLKADANGNLQFQRGYQVRLAHIAWDIQAVQASDGGYAMAAGGSAFECADVPCDFSVLKTAEDGSIVGCPAGIGATTSVTVEAGPAVEASSQIAARAATLQASSVGLTASTSAAGTTALCAGGCTVNSDCDNASFTYVALGDSYSSGFGLEPFFPGTHLDSTDPASRDNDCQRSMDAYALLLAPRIGLDANLVHFHACQGAHTGDFYNKREARVGGSWNEDPQLQHLEEAASRVNLVTFTIGGNDAHFAETVTACVKEVFETCSGDTTVTQPVDDALKLLDGQTINPACTDPVGHPGCIVPYDKLLADVRAKTPFSKRVLVDYPPFFPPAGSAISSFPGARCQGVQAADQVWLNEKSLELDSYITRHARRNGFGVARPDFGGHEYCSGGEEWFFPVCQTNVIDCSGLFGVAPPTPGPGAFHPNFAGHVEIVRAIRKALEAQAALPAVQVGPQQTVLYRFSAENDLMLLTFNAEWPGSDVEITLTSPSGLTYTRSAPGIGVVHTNGPTWEHFGIPNPEGGEWAASLYGAAVNAAGEPVTIDVFQEHHPNLRPVASIVLRAEGSSLVLDGSGSHDLDGSIASWDWYVSDGSTDHFYTGRVVSVPVEAAPQGITLVVTDNGGLTDFRTVNMVPIDVMPGSDVNPITVRSTGKTPVALLSSPTLNTTTIDASKLRLGPSGASPAPAGVHQEDVNGDGLIDLMLQFPTRAIGLTKGMTTLCMTGQLPDGHGFQACDHIRAQ